MGKMALAADRGLLVASIGAAVIVTDTSAAKKPRPAHVVASADFIQVSHCVYEPFTIHGHIEVNAFDDDPSFVVNSTDTQDDRVSIQITYANGSTWTPDALGISVSGNEAYIADVSWQFGFTLHDGGNPGTALTGDSFGGVPATVDWAHYEAFAVCGDPMFFLTSGNINITPAS